MTNSPKKLSQKLMVKNRLSSTPDHNTLEKLIKDNGFKIIEYNQYHNTTEVSELIQALKVENQISTQNSFVYIDGNIKFVFINSDLKESEKTILLCHELGHIYDKNLGAPEHLYSKIERESFANEFAHYLEHPTTPTKIISIFLKHKLICSLILIFTFASAIYISHRFSVIQAFSPHITITEYYVTPAGEKYHRDFCKHVKYKTTASQMTITDAIAEGYTPCLDYIGE